MAKVRSTEGVKKYEHQPFSKEWEKAADRQARTFAPQIIACKDCGAPNVRGYCCWHCRSVNP